MMSRVGGAGWQFVVCFFLLLGVLALIATKLASKANTPKKLFLVVFGISSVFTILTSNDVVILTLTPIVCAVCAKLEMEPAPFLISMFFAVKKTRLLETL